jgi:hypothetical protein
MAESEQPRGETVTLIRRGKRVEATGAAADYEWWQELPPDQDADSLRGVGYEVVRFFRASTLIELAEELEKMREEESATGLHCDLCRANGLHRAAVLFRAKVKGD